MFLTNRNYNKPEYSVENTNNIMSSIMSDVLKSADTSLFTSTLNTGFPPYNIISIDKGKRYVIELAIAGFSKNEITIEYLDNLITVSGKKAASTANHEYITHGIAYRDFVRSFTLVNDIIVDGAVFENGLLKISFTRQNPAQKNKILIPIK